MFFIVDFDRELILTPNQLGKHIKNKIKAKLIEKVQGECTEKYGYLICVIQINDIPNGMIMDTSGNILFNVSFKAIVMKPFEGEVCDGVIESVTKYGIIVSVCPIKSFISKSDFPPNFEYDENNNTYNSYESGKLEKGTEIRFRIKKLQYDNNGFRPLGTMRESYLGPISEI